MFEFFALAIAVVAFVFARKALNQIDDLRARLGVLEAAAAFQPAQTATAAPPPLAPVAAPEAPTTPLTADEITPEVEQAALGDQPEVSLPPPDDAAQTSQP